MSGPNVLGYVIEAEESRPDLESPFKARLKVRLRNTLGKETTLWLDAPDEVVGFYSLDNSPTSQE